jgi:hypothetical protein
VIRRVTSKLIQAVVNPKVHGGKRKLDDARINQLLSEFFDIILQKINDFLDEAGYLTGKMISVVDIMIYCEIQTVCIMYKRDVPLGLGKLAPWYEKLSGEEALVNVNRQFKTLVD